MKKSEENEIKKNYLRKYQDSLKAMKRIEEYLRELELNEVCPSVSLNGMPTATTYNNKDLSDYAVKKDKLISDLLRARYDRVCIYNDVLKYIESLENEEEKDVLMYRYIKKMQWEDVAKKMSVEWAQIHRIHGRALKNLPLPPE